jgi:hypothetical protein
MYLDSLGARGGAVVKALRYKPEGRGIDLAASVVYGFACWPLVPKIAGSLPTETVGFFLLEKSTVCRPSSNTRTKYTIRTNI